jgi:hypothetical protein
MLMEWNNLDQAAQLESIKVLFLFFNSHGDKTDAARVSVYIRELGVVLELASLDSLFSAPSPFSSWASSSSSNCSASRDAHARDHPS